MIYEIEYHGEIPTTITNPSRFVPIMVAYELEKLGCITFIGETGTVDTLGHVSEIHLDLLELQNIRLREKREAVY